MDAKEILRLLIRNRFWIVLGIAALLPIIGYFVTAGSVKELTETKTNEITSAQQGAQSYTSGTVPNSQYGEFTQRKIGLMEKDVYKAHDQLYDRQAPLLDWPEAVAPQMTEWGRDIPEDISENDIQAVAYVYSQVYDDYAENVYDVVKPWDPATGEGIVLTPPMESLLQTVSFDINNLPSIGKIWQYQENLWVRRSILEVVAEVNRKAGAKDWETAAIKQITRLEVGNSAAIDHRTVAEGYELKDPPDVKKGGQVIEEETKAAAGGGMMGMAPGMEGMMGGGGGDPGMASGYESMMMGMGGGMGMGPGMGGARKGGGPVRFLQPDGVELFRDYPAYVSVLIDQNSIQNLLVEFENSPMTMRVLEANWTRPKTRVQPPVKGQGFMGYAGMGGFGMGMGGGVYGMMDAGMMPGMMGGYEGMMTGMMGQGMMPGMMGGYEGMMPGMMGGRGMGGMANQPRARQKRDLTNPGQKSADGKTKEELDPEKVTIFDPYYNIVELQVYVQARFYYPPAPAAISEEFSPGGELTDDTMADDAMTDEPAEESVAEEVIDESTEVDADLSTDSFFGDPGSEPATPVQETPAAPETDAPADPEAVEPAPEPSPADPDDSQDPPADEPESEPADPEAARF